MKRDLKVAEALWDVKEGIDNVILALKLSDPDSKTIVWYQDGSIVKYGITGELDGNSITNINNAVKVRIGNSVSSIGIQAFDNCTNLSSIIIPDSITSIGDNSFHSCSNLTSVVIPNNVKTIGNSAFAECVNISTLKIGSGVISIGNEAFYNCESLNNSASHLTSYEIPENIKSIGTNAFYGCSSMTELDIESNFYDLNIESDAFYTSSISAVTFGHSDPTISEVQAKEYYPWGLSGGTYIYCYDGTLVVPSGGSGGSS